MVMARRAIGRDGASAAHITLRPLNLQVAEVEIVGLSDLIVHKWSDKAKRLMLEAQQNKTRAKRESKDPEADYQSSQYFIPGGEPGFPAAGFKAAMVAACRLFEGLTMTQAKLLFHVLGEGVEQLVAIKGEVYKREDMVRLETGVADIRYRAAYHNWSATLRVRYNAGVIGLQDLIQLINAAGQCGVGEWRPSAPKSATGAFGMFEVVHSKV